MRLYREKIPAWQRLALQLSVVVGLGSGILAMSELIGSQNAAEEASIAYQAKARHILALKDVEAYNRKILLIAADKPLPANGDLPAQLIGGPDQQPEDIAKQIPRHRERASIFGSLAAIAAMHAGLLLPFPRRRRISDDLTEARHRERADRGGQMPALYDLSKIEFASEEDERTVVTAELGATTNTYVASSYYEHHDVPDAEPSVHPIRSIKKWLAHRREIIAQQTSPDAYVYNEFQPPLNAIEPVSLTV